MNPGEYTIIIAYKADRSGAESIHAAHAAVETTIAALLSEGREIVSVGGAKFDANAYTGKELPEPFEEAEAEKEATEEAEAVCEGAEVPPFRSLRIFVSGAYRAATEEGVEANIQIAKSAGAELLRRGHSPFIPHTMTGHMDRDYPEIPEEVYIACDLAWLEYADAILMLPNWREGEGARNEYVEASLRSLTIFDTMDDVPDARKQVAG